MKEQSLQLGLFIFFVVNSAIGLVVLATFLRRLAKLHPLHRTGSKRSRARTVRFCILAVMILTTVANIAIALLIGLDGEKWGVAQNIELLVILGVQVVVLEVECLKRRAIGRTSKLFWIYLVFYYSAQLVFVFLEEENNKKLVFDYCSNALMVLLSLVLVLYTLARPQNFQRYEGYRFFQETAQEIIEDIGRCSSSRNSSSRLNITPIQIKGDQQHLTLLIKAEYKGYSYAKQTTTRQLSALVVSIEKSLGWSTPLGAYRLVGRGEVVRNLTRFMQELSNERYICPELLQFLGVPFRTSSVSKSDLYHSQHNQYFDFAITGWKLVANIFLLTIRVQNDQQPAYYDFSYEELLQLVKQTRDLLVPQPLPAIAYHPNKAFFQKVGRTLRFLLNCQAYHSRLCSVIQVSKVPACKTMQVRKVEGLQCRRTVAQDGRLLKIMVLQTQEGALLQLSFQQFQERLPELRCQLWNSGWRDELKFVKEEGLSDAELLQQVTILLNSVLELGLNLNSLYRLKEQVGQNRTKRSTSSLSLSQFQI